VAGLARTLWTIIRRDRMASVGLTILVAMIAIAAFAPLIATHDPNAVNERVEGVAVHHDGEGWRDIDVIGDAPLNGVALAAAGTGVAVGFEGEAALLVDGEWDDAPVGDDGGRRGGAPPG
jgi:ABC-type dipeptide/oligopeptide/nickel transport system permease subunit